MKPEDINNDWEDRKIVLSCDRIAVSGWVKRLSEQDFLGMGASGWKASIAQPQGKRAYLAFRISGSSLAKDKIATRRQSGDCYGKTLKMIGVGAKVHHSRWAEVHKYQPKAVAAAKLDCP